MIFNWFKLQFKVKLKLKCGTGRRQPWRFKVKLKLKRGNERKQPQSVEWSNTFKLQFKVKLKLKRENEESNPGFKVKLKLKRGNEESNPGGKFWSNTFKLQFKFKVKLEVKRHFQLFSAFMILAFKLQFKLKLELKRQFPALYGLALNPVGFVSVLVDGDLVLANPLVIIMYLDDKYPQYPLLPSDIHKRYSNQFLGPALCQLVVANSNECLPTSFPCPSASSKHKLSGVHSVPDFLLRMKVLFLDVSAYTLHTMSTNYIGEKVIPDEKLPWVQGVLRKCFTALEKLLKDHMGRYETGDEISWIIKKIKLILIVSISSKF
ncbi:hypothetical protein Ahy_A10g049272 [Arachis hypogaea]|uniref:GST N-terminal domain-containing protein n=1 Tax=Arachis hypogaea TaxID=3818 RepID=A0A445B6W1_ARAHY|nr:hypothetical protein Ahy_A10g049272 [Arachis hypogaea]